MVYWSKYEYVFEYVHASPHDDQVNKSLWWEFSVFSQQEGKVISILFISLIDYQHALDQVGQF